MGHNHRTRREWMATVGAGVLVGTAGCLGDGDGETGSDDDSSGGSQQDGEPVREIVLLNDSAAASPVRYEEAQMIAETWQELGLDVTLQVQDFQRNVEDVIVNQEYDMWNISYGGSPERLEPDFWFNGVFHTSQQQPGSYNFYLWENERFDEVAEEQVQLFDEDERKELIDEGQEILASDVPAVLTHAQTVIDPYNSELLSNLTEMPGEGLENYWNLLSVEVDDEDNTLVLGTADQLENQNPLMTQTTMNRNVFRLIYDRLLQVSPDVEPEPWAAESYEVVDDTTIEVTLRDGMEFHDGEPVTAEDIQFSFDLQSEHGALTPGFLGSLESTEIIDDLNVRFNLSSPNVAFLHNGLGFTFILPKHIWEGIDDEPDVDSPSDWANPEMIGSGAFRFEDHMVDEEFRALANDDHFSRPNIDRFIYVFSSGPSQAVNHFEVGDFHGVTLGAGSDPQLIQRAEDADEAEILISQSHGMDYVALNTSREPFDDLAFRRALAYAAPVEEMLELLHHEETERTHSWITQANERWHNPDVEQFSDDMDLARQELEDAGYSWDDEGNLLYPD